ncbi:Amidase enhancer precursor [compost metagenome]
MRHLWAVIGFFGVLISFIPVAESSLTTDKEIVRVRLLTEKSQITLTGQGLHFQAFDKKYQPVAIPRSSVAQIRVIYKDGKKMWSVRLDNKDPEQIYSDNYLLVRGDNLRAGSKALPKKLLLNSSGPQKIDVVGVIPLDEYVMGVIASEMPLSWPMESLKAQAVAARSYALAVMKERMQNPWHLESSVLDQVFRHVLAEDENDQMIQKAVLAVRATQGVKLLSPKNGKILKAFYHADCGGRTSLAKDVWQSGVNTGTAVDSSCPITPTAQWTLRLTAKELIARMGVELSGLKLIRPTAVDRVSKVLLTLNDVDAKTLNANEFRQKIGFQDLKSTQFDVKKEGDSFVFKGRGFGHGVGLCQWGSRTLGQKGLDYKDILRHYYPLAQIQGPVLAASLQK